MRIQNVELGISLPKKAMTFLSAGQLKWAGRVQERHRRNERELENELKTDLVRMMQQRRNQPLMDEEQTEIFGRCTELLELKEGWVKIKEQAQATDVKKWLNHIPRKGERTIATGKATGVADCSAEEAAAWQWSYCSRERCRVSKEQGHPARIELKNKARANESIFATVVKFPFPLKSREFIFKQIWKSEEGKVTIAIQSIPDLKVDYGFNKRKLKGYTRGVWQFENLPDKGKVKQCKITFVTYLDTNGFFPTRLVNNLVPDQLDSLTILAENFQKDEIIDREDSARLETIIREKWADEVYTVQENNAILNGIAFLQSVKDSSLWIDVGDDFDHYHSMNDIRWKLAHLENDKLATGIVEAVVDAKMEKIAAWEFLKTSRESTAQHLKKSGVENLVQADLRGGKGWGKTSIEVRAGMEEVAAFFWDFDSRANIEISDNIERRIVNEGDWKRVVIRMQRLTSKHHGHHSNRRFVNEMTLHKLDDETMLLLARPVDEEFYGIYSTRRTSVVGLGDNVVKAKDFRAIKMKKAGAGKTRVEMALVLETGHNIGVNRRATKASVEKLLGEIASMAIYFHQLKPLGDYGAGSGEVLGHALLWNASSAKKRLERLEVMMKGKALQAFVKQHTWFPLLMRQALSGRLSLGKPVKTKLVCITDTEATQIGKNLIPALTSKKLAEAGIDQWKVQNRAVGELMEKHEWFGPMILVVSKGIVKSAAWGLLWRIMVGAVLSVTDMGTDILVLKQFWEGGKQLETYRNFTLGSLASSIFLQLIIAFLQNFKMGPLRLLREFFIVLTGMKSPVDAYRVAFRHANEMGGLYWTFNNIVIVATLFLALKATEEKGAIEEEKMATLWRVAMYLAIAEFVTFAVFLLNINRQFISTFFSIETGGQLTVRTFLENSSDAIKFHAVFSVHPNQWKRIKQDVVRWLEIGWDTWMEENPRWFLDEKDWIPQDMRPVRLDRRVFFTASKRTKVGAKSKIERDEKKRGGWSLLGRNRKVGVEREEDPDPDPDSFLVTD
ncbi:hypothetical protein TrLO_g4614 [Triparma laevis f. longispina]|uniref:Uncharacterized protein n=1 Tax=Triparma laevis f. longispina TaxID=1714387 RepID=A0A9W7FUF5_9STRA|nr:hypothetical protein TrLO_g4614 [Triparma laevis f. longispina]